MFKGAPKRHKKSGKAGSATLKTKMLQPLSIEHEKQVCSLGLCLEQLTVTADAGAAPALSACQPVLSARPSPQDGPCYSS